MIHLEENTVLEATRYIANAREILKEKAKKFGDHYTDRKYVRMACNTAWNGVLLAINAYLLNKGVELPNKPTKNDGINTAWYQDKLGKHNKKLLSYFNDSYTILHIEGGYKGFTNYNTIQEGLRVAEKIIDIV